MKRWMAGAATVLAAAAGLAASGPAAASSSAWYQTLQVSRSGTFSQVAAISQNNIWAVGELWGKKGNTIYQPFVRHYAGRGWATVTFPGSPKFESYQVSASAANNVWVFGFIPSSVYQSVVYRYDGSHWHKIPVPTQTALQGAVALGPNNVWAFGSSASVFATVFHWNGSKWRGYNVAHGTLVPESISASAGNNVWVAGSVRAGKARQAVAYRWNGTGWHDTGLPRVLNDLPGVSVVSRANVWIGWNAGDRSHATHWDGRHWNTLSVPGNVIVNTSNVVPDGEGGYWFGGSAILTGGTWASEPPIEVSGGFADVVRIPGTKSFLWPAGVRNLNSTIQEPTLYRFDL